jgi:hypothetical protein
LVAGIGAFDEESNLASEVDAEVGVEEIRELAEVLAVSVSASDVPRPRDMSTDSPPALSLGVLRPEVLLCGAFAPLTFIFGLGLGLGFGSVTTEDEESRIGDSVSFADPWDFRDLAFFLRGLDEAEADEAMTVVDGSSPPTES